MPGKLRVTQTKSTISHIARNRATVKALGLHGIGTTSVVDESGGRLTYSPLTSATLCFTRSLRSACVASSR